MQLQHWQQQLLGIAVGGEAGTMQGLKPAGRLSLVEATGVYQNNTVGSRINALIEIYTHCTYVLGEQYMRQLCGKYARTSLSLSVDLNDYGENFSAFISAEVLHNEALLNVTYLSDVATLDWEIHQLLRQQNTASDRSLLSNADRLKFSIHPSCRLLCSEYPLHTIVQLNHNPENGWLDEQGHPPYYLMIQSVTYNIQIHCLDAIQYKLLSIMSDITLQELIAKLPDQAQHLSDYLPQWLASNYLRWELIND